MRNITWIGLAAFFLAATLQASVSVNFIQTGPDGVLPYEITLNGIQSSAVCYDNFDGIPNPPWQANLLTLAQAQTTGFFKDKPNALDGYQEVAWLSQQSFTGVQQEIALQYDIWNVFDPGALPDPSQGTPDPVVVQDMQNYLDAYDTAKAASFSGAYAFDFSQIVFIEPVSGSPGAPGTDQAFVALISLLPPQITSVPEPRAATLMAGGLLLTISTVFFRKRRKAAGQAA